ncbi:hypothetical protein C8A03DRAFT_37820 [Achaetomium macrosporum]|uniref:Uncharacterized protein n=1 Tax=Achaetomium macrosporum TaxID=79813 RepID=A0AAN7C374_9PEZI|nr:hypothetical protein C8A03DRAFT_37820 [Achaetomium macrosporum]
MAIKERSVPIAQVIAAVFAATDMGLTAYLISGDGTASARLRLLHFTSIRSLFVLAFLALPGLFHRIPDDRPGPRVHHHDLLAGRLCRAGRAAVAFGFFLFALFCFLVVADALGLVRGV